MLSATESTFKRHKSQTRASKASDRGRFEGSGLAERVGGGDGAKNPAALLDRPRLRGVIDEDHTEALLVAPRPLEVIEQRPHEVAGERHPVGDRPGRRTEVLAQVLDALEVV